MKIWLSLKSATARCAPLVFCCSPLRDGEGCCISLFPGTLLSGVSGCVQVKSSSFSRLWWCWGCLICFQSTFVLRRYKINPCSPPIKTTRIERRRAQSLLWGTNGEGWRRGKRRRKLGREKNVKGKDHTRGLWTGLHPNRSASGCRSLAYILCERDTNCYEQLSINSKKIVRPSKILCCKVLPQKRVSWIPFSSLPVTSMVWTKTTNNTFIFLLYQAS